MPRTVFKYVLPRDWTLGEVAVPMPKDATLLRADYQGAELCVWAEVDPDAPEVRRFFMVYATGQDHATWTSKVYVSTVFSGPFVFHVYDHGEHAK